MSDLLFPQDTTGVTPASWDIILIADVSDSNNTKDCTLAELPISTATQTALNSKQDTLVSWTNIKTINSTSILWSGDIVISGGGSVATDAIWDAKGDLAVGTGSNTASRLAVGTNGQVLTADSAEATGTKWATVSGSGDMILASTQTVSGLKTFLNAMFALRNVANTFSGLFTNTNTADRTYTLQNRNWTLADDTDLALKANLASPTFTGTVVFPSGQALIAPVLGTPTSGTLTNCTGLPLAWVVDSTTEALGVWSLEVWHATDTTISRVSAGAIAVEGVTVPTISSTSTLTNKRNQPRIVSAASYTTDTGTSLDFSTCDIFIVTAQAGALLFNNPSGTPQHGEKIIIRCKDNWTARPLTYGTQYRAVWVTLPTTTVINKTTYLCGIWNATDTKLDILVAQTEA